jgi:tetratricopeptide (TPR) repeat protein
MTRLQALGTAAMVLAGVAGVTNYAYWRRHSSRQSAVARPPTASIPPWPADARPQQIRLLTEHLAQHPHNADARFQLAELYFKLQDYPRSLVELRTLERDRPNDPNVFLRQAVVLKYSGQPDRAEKAVRRALALSPRYEPAWEWLGEIYLDQERYRQALECFNRCLQSRPDSYSRLLGKGRALEQLLVSRHPIPISAVIQPVEKAVQLAPSEPEGLATLARMTFAYRQQPDEAERLALRAAELDRLSARPYNILAQIALSRAPTPENLRRAGEYAYEAGRRDLHDPRPPYFVGRVLLQQNDIPRAVKALERSIELGPMPEAVSQLAVAYRRAGNVGQASHYAEIYQRYTDLMGRRNALLAARERQPSEARHDYALAELYLEAGQPDTAEYWAKEARRVKPRDPHGDPLMARLRQLRKKGSHALLLPIP